MKDLFFDYYPPNSEQYERLWKEAIITLDTNVILNLYRLPTTATDELLKLIELLGDRIWIPHQVALEFQRRRLTVISSERKSSEDALSTAKEVVLKLKERVDSLQIDKRSLGIEVAPLIENLDSANKKLIEAIEAVHKSQLDIAAPDPIRERLDKILSQKVGDGPSTQEELDKLTEGGDQRFEEKIPPGFADIDKEKNPNEASFIFNQMKYQRKFGDLILWRQIISHVKEKGIKCVILVTADKKEDWWWREQGKTIGPHPELIREIRREGNVDIFWMYSSVQFVEHAKKYTQANVSEQSVAELQEVVSNATAEVNFRNYVSHTPIEEFVKRYPSPPRAYGGADRRAMEKAVYEWLSLNRGYVRFSDGRFPSFVVRDGVELHGYEARLFPNFDKIYFSPMTINSLLRGYVEVKEGRISKFTLIGVVSEDDAQRVFVPGRISEIQFRIREILKKYPITGIVVGVIADGKFRPLVSERSSDYDDLVEYSDDP
ncbi:PIN domain-containing protein [Mesorhizobium sp. CA14]|uniref:PIN-like domain-containing protein n=1 Tax=Mesorhizobium sp. CA14 TaxID=2876642 RepID=UPI001CCDC5FF|nr:PIN domain-containing protein [Mesorhizobium sp. CA14]MBZ9851485.1 PIN domain-containing protein [Mesorhizobium sp. CA14]